MTIDVVIPTDSVVDERVLASIHLQSVTIRNLIVNRMVPFAFTSRETNININRHALQVRVRANPPDVVWLLDSDVVLEDSHVLRDLLAQLPHCVSSAITTQQNTIHLLASCCVIRWSHYDVIQYLYDIDVCQCRKVGALGLMAYIDQYGRAKELRDL